MLTKCMLTPQMLARSLNWVGISGKSSAVMAIDIRNDYIGIALAYHRQNRMQPAAHEDMKFDSDDGSTCNSTTSITPLPPLPYMSCAPHHPSYSFRHRHRPVRTVIGMPKKPPRVERTLEVALQLAQLASERGVKSVLVRWPGGGASLGLGGGVREEYGEWKQVDEDLLLGSHDKMNIGYKMKQQSLGYQRGRILYVLDKCCGVLGHNVSTSSSFLMEGSRPFALWDTSENEEVLTLSSRLDSTQQCELHLSTSSNTDRLDRYGNSISAIDQWGRAPIFGMPPEYSLKRKAVKPSLPPALSDLGQSGVSKFDSFHDSEEKINQLKGSFPAMLALREFATTHLNGRVALPSWLKLHEDKTSLPMLEDVSLTTSSEVSIGYRRAVTRRSEEDEYAKPDLVNQSKTSNMKKCHVNKESQERLSTLVQMPTKHRRRRSEALDQHQKD
eukprot:CCRYP_016960-RB/>CCRYP_016960-RB protein AED:0.10 eAED:0.10 QI:289/1/1/1/0.5/0.33/3/361/442